LVDCRSTSQYGIGFDRADSPEVCTFGTCQFGVCLVVAVECFPGLQCCKTIDDVICVEGACP
jgi:hypothetical protein